MSADQIETYTYECSLCDFKKTYKNKASMMAARTQHCKTAKHQRKLRKDNAQLAFQEAQIEAGKIDYKTMYNYACRAMMDAGFARKDIDKLTRKFNEFKQTPPTRQQPVIKSNDQSIIKALTKRIEKLEQRPSEPVANEPSINQEDMNKYKRIIRKQQQAIEVLKEDNVELNQQLFSQGKQIEQLKASFNEQINSLQSQITSMIPPIEDY